MPTTRVAGHRPGAARGPPPFKRHFTFQRRGEGPVDPNGQGHEQSKADRYLLIKKALRNKDGTTTGTNTSSTSTIRPAGLLNDQYDHLFVRMCMSTIF
jgi:hypothetical protein